MTELRMAISPDSDDAFMAWAIVEKRIDLEGLEFTVVRDDVETLNQHAASDEPPFDVSAISFGALPVLADRWSVLRTGASFGLGTGPKLVANGPVPGNAFDSLQGSTVALPGEHTSAALLFAIAMGKREWGALHLPFDRIAEAVSADRPSAGVIIHEAGLQLAKHDLVLLQDLGAWWHENRHGLPLPLGGIAVRRDLSVEVKDKVQRVLRAGVEAGLENREEALAFASPVSKGLGSEELDQYVADYVNPLSVDFGDEGERALRIFLGEGEALGFIKPTMDRLEIIQG